MIGARSVRTLSRSVLVMSVEGSKKQTCVALSSTEAEYIRRPLPVRAARNQSGRAVEFLNGLAI